MTARLHRLIAWLIDDARPLYVPLLRIFAIGYFYFQRVFGLEKSVQRVLDRADSMLVTTHVSDTLALFGLWPLTQHTLHGIWLVAVVSGACAVIGLCTRPALLALFLSTSALIGLQAGWGFFNHTPSMPITIMLALFILPGATACSVDAVLMNAWRKFRGRGVLWRDWRGWMFAKTPRFGDVFVLLLIGVVYAAAGIAKLKAGVVWLDGSALAYYFSREAREQLWLKDGERVIAYSYLSSPSALALWIGKHQIAAAITSWATIFVEAIAPLALLWSNATRVLFGIAAIVFHVAVRTMMGIPFYDWIVVDVVIVTIALAAMIVRARQRKAPG